MRPRSILLAVHVVHGIAVNARLVRLHHSLPSMEILQLTFTIAMVELALT
jgi:hypothetical protein